MDCASKQVLEMLAMVLAPLGQPNPGAQLYHFVGNITEEPAYGACHPECQFPQITALGDSCGIIAAGFRKRVDNDDSENNGAAELLVPSSGR